MCKLLYNNTMQIKLKLTPKIAYLFSIIAVTVFLLYFAYSAIIAYLIHKELYGGGIDILVTLRASLAGIMIFLILLLCFFQNLVLFGLKWRQFMI